MDGTARSGLGHLLDRLAREQGFSVIDVQPIDPGVAHNNRLYRLRARDGRVAVVKCYFRDDRRRSGREHGALTFLQARGIVGVPKPLLRDDLSYAAVYSFECEITVSTGHAAAGRRGVQVPQDPGRFHHRRRACARWIHSTYAHAVSAMGS